MIEKSIYKNFLLSEIFGKCSRGAPLHADEFIPGDLPFLASGNKNNGIVGYISNDVTIYPRGSIAISMFGFATYRDYDYGADGGILVFDTSKIDRRACLFIVASINKAIKGVYDFGHKMNSSHANALVIALPALPDGSPDYDFMADHIRKVEAEHIREVEAYLKVTGLDSSVLTERELDALEAYKTGEVKLEKFKIGDVFEVKPSRGIHHANNVTIYDSSGDGRYPYVVRSTVNNGIRGYLSEGETSLNEGNTISFAQDTFVAFYQESPYYTGNKVKILSPKEDVSSDGLVLIFISGSINKSVATSSWGQGSTISSISNTKLTLPVTDDGTPDYEFMRTYIRAIQKKSIANLVIKQDAEEEKLKDLVK